MDRKKAKITITILSILSSLCAHQSALKILINLPQKATSESQKKCFHMSVIVYLHKINGFCILH